MGALDWVRRSQSEKTPATTPLAIVAKGALAGFAGTIVLTIAVKAS